MSKSVPLNNSTTGESLRGEVNRQRKSGRFTSVAHRADIAAPADETTDEQAEQTPAQPITSNDIVRAMSNRT